MRADSSFHALKSEPELLMEIIMRAPTATGAANTQQSTPNTTAGRRVGLGPGAGAGAGAYPDSRLDSMFF